MKNDLAYNNVDHIPGGADFPDRWAVAARGFRDIEAAVGRARLNDPYGLQERQKMDMFYPDGPAHGLAMFVHGGYWMKFDRSYWSHLAAGITERGWVVAMPSYTLAPEARISEITTEIASALLHAADRVQGPIRLIGHSAGGHLALRMICDDVALSGEVRSRIEKVLPISPVADLRPLLETSMKKVLRLDADEASRESPVLQKKTPEIPVTTWVGGNERPAFLDQSRWLSEAWDDTDLVIEEGRHHFDVIEGLADPASALTSAVLG